MIPLGKGIFAIVDEIDLLPALLYSNWNIHSKGYASNGRGELLHYFIAKRMSLTVPDNFEIDHIDRNKLNNRRNNLRVVTQSEQIINQDLRIDNTSGHKGISFCKQTRKWRPLIQRKGRIIRLPRCVTIEEALKIRKEWLERNDSA